MIFDFVDFKNNKILIILDYQQLIDNLATYGLIRFNNISIEYLF